MVGGFAVDVEPLRLRFPFHVSLGGEVVVELVVGEGLVGPVLVAGTPPPENIRRHIGGVGLLVNPLLDRLVGGVADLGPTAVAWNFRRGVGVDHWDDPLEGLDLWSSHYLSSLK